MKTFYPKVSIVIPVYNGSNYLKEAIDSALAQTYQNIEIIVINDGSKDDGATEKIAKSYGNKIEYYRKENGGVATALNLGIQKMTGEYFSWLSHDDTYKPYKLQKQVEYLQKLEDKDVVLFSNYSVMDENGKHQYDCILNHAMLADKPIYALLRGNINGITMLVPKKAFDEYGDFDVMLRCTQDYDMWYRMIKTYAFVHMFDVLSNTRVHASQDTQSNPRVVTEGNELWTKMIAKLPDNDKRKAEGSLFKFYIEMIRFLRQTPYKGALEYCTKMLEESVSFEEAIHEGVEDLNVAKVIYKELIEDNQKRAAAYFLEGVVKELVNKNRLHAAADVMSEMLVGKGIGVEKNYIEKHYVTKIKNKSDKPRIMFCSGQWLTGGMERVMSILFSQLKDEYEIFLFTAYDGQQGKIEIPEYVTHIKMSVDYFWNSFDHRVLAHALIFDIDVAIGFMNLFDGQLDFYKLCEGTRVKTVASNHEIYFYPYSNPLLFDIIQKRIDVYKNVDASLWLTNFSAAAYGLVASNSYLMPNPNTYKLQDKVNSSDEKIILCVARFNDYIKRVDRMLECFSIVSKTHPEAKLMLVGKYDREVPVLPDKKTTINDLIKIYNINEDKIAFMGEVANVEEYYSKASLLLLTSTNEGFGMVINEAASFGVPTVCSKIPGLEDLITDGENGFITEQGDIAAMAKAVDSILSDIKLRKKMGENAKRMVARFDEVEIGNKWKYLLNTLMEEGGKDIGIKLNEQLAYKIDDQKEFSRLLFNELNNTIAISRKERNELLKAKSESENSALSKKFARGYQRLRKALKTKGIIGTAKIIIRVLYRLMRKMMKRS